MRLAASNEPASTDHTGEIISFSDIGSGAPGSTRPWACYTAGDATNVRWQFPDMSTVPAGVEPATSWGPTDG